jgi:magnesium chelatase family protein
VKSLRLAWLAVLAAITTFTLEGIHSHEVTVEVDVRRGLPTFTLVGLPDRAVRESRERVRAALLNSELDFPQQRITVNLAPAHVHKAGPGFDLGIAVGVLVATGQVPAGRLDDCALAGELSLSGEIRPIRGALAAALGARGAGYRRLLVPVANAPEAALVDGVEVGGMPSLARLSDLLHGRWEPQPVEPALPVAGGDARTLDLSDVRGQEDAKRALEITAAGGHNLLMVGPPGAGKTMLARRLPGILPPPSFEEALEITQMHSAAGIGSGRLAAERPFRAPHHTISAQGLVGGGARPMPGEITLAHRGVLFLDELPEFGRMAVDSLRQPLEEGRVEVTRGQRTLEFPANAIVVGACNRCPCARPPDQCRCEAGQLARYQRRLSGPLVDRIDLVCQVEPVPAVELVDPERAPALGSAEARARVVAARARQRARLRGTGALCNGDMDGRMTRRLVPLQPGLAGRLLAARGRIDLSGRGHDRVLRVARTIADLDDRDHVEPRDLDEALSYRIDGWGRLAA